MTQPDLGGGRGLPQHRWIIERLVRCDSTNAVLLERARQGARDRSVILAEHQIAGRGRRGRPWLAPPGDSLTFSLLWRSRRSAARFGLIPIAAGVACARALAGLGAAVGLKWPNDLVGAARGGGARARLPLAEPGHAGGGHWGDSSKLGGILVESAVTGAEPAAVVVGIGINLRGGRKLGEQLRRPIADLAAICDRPVHDEDVLAEILLHMEETLGLFESGGDDEIIAGWAPYDVLYGREVVIETDGTRVRGIARGLAGDGALKVDTPDCQRLVYSGTASLHDSGG